MSSEVKIKVPDEVISNLIHAEIAKQLGPDNRLVEAVVRSALEQKKDNYSRETLFGDQVKNMIRGKAQDVFKSWLDQHAKEIEQAFLKFLTKNKAKVIRDFCHQLATNLGRFYFSLNLKIDDE